MTIKLYNDHFQNYKHYQIQKAQLVIADIPYNIGNNAYGSNPAWYVDGDNKNGESKLAGKGFFDTDKNFNVYEFLHFCSKMLVKEPKEKGKAPCMIVFCEFEQQFMLIQEAKKHGLNNYINLVFRKNFSAQVLKANMRVVGNCEYAVLFYRDKLPKFNNNGKMIFNCIDWERDFKDKKIHPCLPAGQKVYFNNKWKNIEDVEIGDYNRFGKVISLSNHFAEKLVEITVGKTKTIATWNHPFLVKRGNKIYWINAEKIKNEDFILTSVSAYSTLKPSTSKKELRWLKNTKKQKRAISDTQKIKMGDFVLSIVLYGKKIMVKFPLVCKYTIKILTGRITRFPICNLLRPLSTSGSTLVVDLLMENGKNRVKYVENIKNAIRKTGIIPEGGLTVKYVKNVILKNQLKQERFLLQRVGSVRVIRERTKVYNLTMDKIPVFDTMIGVSHNTQKPINLLMRLIQIFTDEGDVIIDPVAGSGSTLIAAHELNRNAYGFEIKKEMCAAAQKWIDEYTAQGVLFA